MTEEIRKQAQAYVRQSLEAQKRLGYSSSIDKKVYEEAVTQTARAMAHLMKAQRRSEPEA